MTNNFAKFKIEMQRANGCTLTAPATVDRGGEGALEARRACSEEEVGQRSGHLEVRARNGSSSSATVYEREKIVQKGKVSVDGAEERK